MKSTTIRKIKLGEFFKFVPSGRMFVRGEYDRSSRTFAYYPFDDVNDEHFARGERRVLTDFEF